MHYFSGVKSFLPVQNHQPIIDAIKKINSKNKALSIASYDCSLFVCLLAYVVIILLLLMSLTLYLIMFLCVNILYCNFTIIQYFLETDFFVFNVVLLIYFVFIFYSVFIHLLVHTCALMYIFLHLVVLNICNVCLLFALLFICFAC